MKKISRKYYTLVFGIAVSLFMSSCMSFVMTVVNIGFTQRFFIAWIRAFVIGFAVALPVSLIIIPVIRKNIEKVFK